jgi:phosphatidylserine decarboxylase
MAMRNERFIIVMELAGGLFKTCTPFGATLASAVKNLPQPPWGL